MKGRIALVTGASRGIGAAVAIRFACEGAHVIAVGRDTRGLEATDDAIRKQTNGATSATLVPLDLTEYDKIDLLASGIAQRFGKLDILVGNAAILTDMTPLPHIAPADWDKVMAINVTANWHLIRACDALLKNSDAPRAMFVTSGVTTHASPYWGAYAVSKTALESLVTTYAAENIKSSLKANLIDPGVVRTRMRAQAFPGEDPLTLPEAASITDLFVKLASPALTQTGEKFFARNKGGANG